MSLTIGEKEISRAPPSSKASVNHQSALELIGDLPSALSYDGINPGLPPPPWPLARRRRGGALALDLGDRGGHDPGAALLDAT